MKQCDDAIIPAQPAQEVQEHFFVAILKPRLESERGERAALRFEGDLKSQAITGIMINYISTLTRQLKEQNVDAGLNDQINF